MVEPGIAGLAADAFEKAERVRMLEMMNPIKYEDRKAAYIELQIARHEAIMAERALKNFDTMCQFSQGETK